MHHGRMAPTCDEHGDNWCQKLPFCPHQEDISTDDRPTASKTKSHLLDLPLELKTAIVSWVFRPDHLASICLVSKQLHDVAIPLLYHSLFLNVDRWKSEHLDCVLARGHRGHRYIRALDIDSDQLELEDLALKVAKSALQVLARDCLRSFRCPLESGIDNDLMVLLASTQRRLSFLGIGPLLENATSILDCLRPWPPTIETVVIPWKINGTRDVEFYQQIIERSAKTLKALTVRVEEIHAPWDESFSDIDSINWLAKGLFKHFDPAQNLQLLELNDLNFQNQDFTNFDTNWLLYIDFARLKTLQIWNCDCADDLLSGLLELAKNKPLQLHGLVLSFENPMQAPSLAQEFLRSISGLQYLNLCYVPEADTDASFDIRCLENHKSIKDLYIGIGTNSSPRKPDANSFFSRYPPPLSTLSTDDLNWLSSNCPNLRQLAIALPIPLMGRTFTECWPLYGPAIEQLARLPRLKTLRLLTWPVAGDMQEVQCQHRKVKLEIYCTYLDIIAESFVRLLRRSQPPGSHRLSVLTFGSAEERDMLSDEEGNPFRLVRGPVTYKVRAEQSEFGSLLKVERIEPQMMEYEEPISYVVDEDTDQGLSLEAYSWGSGC